MVIPTCYSEFLNKIIRKNLTHLWFFKNQYLGPYLILKTGVRPVRRHIHILKVCFTNKLIVNRNNFYYPKALFIT